MKRLFDLANLILLFLLGALVYRSYPGLPERVPMHFDLAGRPDRWGGRGGLVGLLAVPFVITVVLYALGHYLPRLGANARSMNIPHREEFLKLPAEKQEIFWVVFRDFFAGLTASTNLLFYLIIRGTVRIAAGGASILPFKLMLPALGLMGLVMITYLRRLITLPGKLVRGEE
jgi:uncharacterized membrane protein